MASTLILCPHSFGSVVRYFNRGQRYTEVHGKSIEGVGFQMGLWRFGARVGDTERELDEYSDVQARAQSPEKPKLSLSP